MQNEYLARSRKQPSRREREKARQRRDMLEAALILFSEKGYHNVTMHEIASKAEFAIGTLYKFFKNKEDLYKALILEKTDAFHAAIAEAIEEYDDELDRLRNYLKVKGEIFRAHVPVIRLYFSEKYGEGFNLMAELNEQIRQRHEEFLKILAGVFESGMRKNRFRKIAPPHTLAVALDGISTVFLFRRLEEPGDQTLPEDPDAILDILLKGLAE
ncbi:MAG: TetR/AcrR family transcriptional regulator [Desulfomonilia bacterium]|jgi:TetR/AcrR family transcriptional regulator|uniref:HTH-type transcriptional regulator RutR n=1 Tax=anaerobic digester metagenome TaxID=1263854 RepID=A0A485LYP2_9ZZZZ|nr:TetR/AcrR family transcriptional regulator [Pseudomonadota bacterium]